MALRPRLGPTSRVPTRNRADPLSTSQELESCLGERTRSPTVRPVANINEIVSGSSVSDGKPVVSRVSVAPGSNSTLGITGCTGTGLRSSRGVTGTSRQSWGRGRELDIVDGCDR